MVVCATMEGFVNTCKRATTAFSGHTALESSVSNGLDNLYGFARSKGIRRYAPFCCHLLLVGHMLQQRPKLRARDAITLAGRLFETLSIHNNDVAMSIANEPRLLKRRSGDGDAGTSCAEHHRKVFVCESDFFGVDAIVRQQEPPRASLVDIMHTVACGKLPQHVDISLEKSVKHSTKPAISAVEQLSEMVAADDDRAPGNLAITFVSRGRCSE